MFSTFKQRLVLGIYVFLILSIPIGAYLASQHQTVKSSASENKPAPSASPAKSAGSSSIKDLLGTFSNSSPEPTSPIVATSFGPTLSLSAILEGRPKSNQATKLFVGIIEGSLTKNPKFLLSFTVDLPASGQYSNLSLAGLTPGTQYTALLKGSAQIATSSAFIMSPAVTNLNDGQPLTMLSGDLNDDNAVTSSDYSIIQKVFGLNSKSQNWNDLADFDKNRLINAFDLAIVSKNLNKMGASGTWTSPLPKTASSSASLNSPSTGSAQGGYWIWIPSQP